MPADLKAPLSELERCLVDALQGRSEIEDAYLFGSQATGRARSHSDIDVAVHVDLGRLGRAQYGYAAELTAHLMGALGSNDIDVVVLNGAPPVLYHRVLRDGRRILSRDARATAAREGYALSRYCDFVPQLAKMESARRAAAAQRGR